MCCCSWVLKELDTSEWLNDNISLYVCIQTLQQVFNGLWCPVRNRWKVLSSEPLCGAFYQQASPICGRTGLLKSLMHQAGTTSQTDLPHSRPAWSLGKWSSSLCEPSPNSPLCMTQKAWKCPKMTFSIELKKHCVGSACLKLLIWSGSETLILCLVCKRIIALKKKEKKGKPKARQWYHITKRLG